MIFGHPRVLWLALILVPLAGWFLWWTWRKRQEVIRQFVRNRYLTEISVGATAGMQKLRRVLLLAALAFLLLALARPQWGFSWEQASQRSRDIIIAIDTSRSMFAADTAPNRLTRAKLAALDLQKLAKYDRLGLIAFAGTAFLQCPLTLDDEAFRQSVQILDPSIIPQGGTAIGEAIEAARKAFEEDEVENHKILVLMTDGEDHEEKALEVAQSAAGEGMRIFTIGVGSPAGELLQVRDESGKLVYVKDEAGNVVKSRLNEGLLQQLATAGNGFYLPLQGGNPMEVLYQKGLAPLPTSDRSTKLMRKAREQYFWPLSIGILLLMIEALLPDRKRASRSTLAGASGAAAAVSILAVLLSISPASGSPSSAQKKYQAKEYKGSLEDYEELIKRHPTDPRLRYNAGAAAYQAKKFDQALEQFQSAAAAPDLTLQQLAYYNLGNTQYRLGEANSDPKERMTSWQQALQHYDAAIKLNTNDMDAQFNRELVQKKLEELKQQQPEQQDQNSQDPSDDQKDNEEKKDQKNQSKDQKNQQEQKDQSSQDQKDSEKKEQDSSTQQAQNQQQQEQKQEKQEQQQAKSGQQKEQEEREKQEGSQAGGSGGEEKPDAAAEQAQYAQLGQMSPAQARQLLDAQKGEEKALIFVPNQTKKRSPNDRTFKDW